MRGAHLVWIAAYLVNQAYLLSHTHLYTYIHTYIHRVNLTDLCRFCLFNF